MSSEPTTSVFKIDALEQQRAQRHKPYLEFLRVSAMSAGVYVLAKGASDLQRPHEEDEIYYVIRGKARFRAGNADYEVSTGTIIFVPAKLDHRFFDIAEEITLLVVFAPAES